MRPVTDEEQAKLDNDFTYHPPAGADQLASYGAVREAGKALAKTILEHTIPCADQSAAIRKVREAVMTTNAAIATGFHATTLGGE
jgi:hypothetical protein